MDLESQSLSSPRGHKPHPNADNRSQSAITESATSFNDNDDYSSQSDSHRGGKRNRGASLDSSTPNSKKRKRIEERNAVVFYNIPPRADRHILNDFVERMFQEMHGTRAAIVKCQCISCTSVYSSFLVVFDTPDHAEIAMSFNGVHLMGNTICVNIYNPTTSDSSRKLRLCVNHCVGACKHGDNCRHAHGVLDLKLYHNTVLSEKRAVYINNFPFRYPPKDLLNMIKKKYFEFHGMSPFFTAFHVRAEKGDALVEFADIRHAKKAFEILNGVQIGTFQLEVHPWNPKVQSGWVKYFQKESRNMKSPSESPSKSTISDGTSRESNKPWNMSSLESSSKSTRSEDTPRMNTPESAHVTPEKQASNEAQASQRTMQASESPFAVGSEDDKRELQRLRDKILQLQDQTSDYKRLLDKAHDDVQYYRERFKTAERSYSKDHQTMQDKLEDLQRDKDRLVREMDYLRTKQNDSSFGRYREMDNPTTNRDLVEELRETRLKYENSRDRLYQLERELDTTREERDDLLADSIHLKSTVKHLESNQNNLKREHERGERQEELQRQLDEALSKIEELSEVVTTTHLQLRDLESEKATTNKAIVDLQEQNETLEEEMQQMRMNHAMEIGFMNGGG